MLEFLPVPRGGDEHEYVTGLDARESTRYDYRQITNLLRIEGWCVNPKRVDNA
jgi:hypothetical protein